MEAGQLNLLSEPLAATGLVWQHLGGTISVPKGWAGCRECEAATFCEASGGGATFCTPCAGMDQAGQNPAGAHSHPELETRPIPTHLTPGCVWYKEKQPGWLLSSHKPDKEQMEGKIPPLSSWQTSILPAKLR